MAITADIFTLNGKDLTTPLTVRLSWQSKPNLKSSGEKQSGFEKKNQSIQLSQNQKITATIKLKPAYGLANQGAFNYQAWLRANAIHGTGYVLGHKPFVISSAIPSLRERLYLRVKALTANYSQQGLMLALLFGERTLFTADTWQVLQKTGTQHLVAISGLHIGLVVAISYFFSFLLLKIVPLRLLPIYVQSWLAKHDVTIFVYLLPHS